MCEYLVIGKRGREFSGALKMTSEPSCVVLVVVAVVVVVGSHGYSSNGSGRSNEWQ